MLMLARLTRSRLILRLVLVASVGMIIVIQRQLGHSNVGTTSRYIDHLQPQQVIEAMQGREWSF